MTYEDFVERPEWPYPAPALAIIVLQPPSPTDTSPTPLIAPNTASSLPADYSYRTKPSMYVDHDVVHVFLATTDSEFSMDNKKILPHFSSSFWTGDSIPYEYADYVRELRKRQEKVVELPPDNQVAPRPFMQKDNGIPLIEFKSLQKAKSQLMLMLEWKELTVRSEEEREKEQWWKDVRNGKDRQSSRFSMWLRHELAGPRQLYGAEYFVSTNRLVRSQSAPSAPNSAQTSTQTMTSSDSTERDSQSVPILIPIIQPPLPMDRTLAETRSETVGAASGVRMVEGSDAVLVVPGLHIPSDESDDEFTRNYSEYGDSVDWDFICGDVMNGYYEVGGNQITDNEVTWREVNGRVRDKAGKRIRGKGKWVGGERKRVPRCWRYRIFDEGETDENDITWCDGGQNDDSNGVGGSCDVHLPGKDPPVSGSGGRAGPYGLLWPGKDPPVSGSGGRAGPYRVLWPGKDPPVSGSGGRAGPRVRMRVLNLKQLFIFAMFIDPPASVSRALVPGSMLGGV